MKLQKRWSAGDPPIALMQEQNHTTDTTQNGADYSPMVIEVYEKEKQELLDICLEMVKHDLVIGSSGNASMRMGEHVVISPSSVHYTEMTIEDVVVIDLDGNEIEGTRNPSVETPMHLEIYKNREDALAVVHTHSVYASSMAALHKPLPPILDEIVSKLGAGIRVSKYAMPGTKQLGINVVKVLQDRSAALIANHGSVCVAKTLKDALFLSILFERACKIYLTAKQAGEPIELPEDVVEDEQDIWEMMKDF
ncbi:MAG: class II aldolase/adducin family protein [Candidatus Thorarchaeota archaeon]|nr:class II aldolase/adducin family protein [Candidatus Thorarchaeota archaeon]